MMNKTLGLVVLATALLVGPSVSLADAPTRSQRSEWTTGSDSSCPPSRRQARRRRGHQVPSVPELDPNAAGQALALLAGAGWLVLGRSRRRVAA